jgi:hypothetical protein
MKLVRQTVLALLTAVSLLASTLNATSFSADQSDIWYIATESGWGIQLVQRGSVIFATMFVYGPTGAPTWYVATMDSSDGLTWTGDLLATTGPWFGTIPFNPATVTVRKAGTMTWTPQSLTAGTLVYVVDGVAVTKNVVRQTLVLDNYGGTYLGAFHAAITGCSNPAGNVTGDVPLVTFTVTQNGATITIQFAIAGLGSQTITGAATQSGQFGSIVGTFSDSTGDSGAASASALTVQANSIAGSFVQDSATTACHIVGYFSGIRTGP